MKLLLFAILTLAVSCSTTNTDLTNNDSTIIKRELPVSVKAILNSNKRAARFDLDGDGGVDKFTTPIGFKVAIKKLTITHENGSKVTLIDNINPLSDSPVLNLKTPQLLDVDSAYSGKYTSAYAEFYYYDIKMELNSPSNYEDLRVYLSDDDFDNEGNLGHHQGDIQLMRDDSTFEWVQSGERWDSENTVAQRPDTIFGASTPDPETGHDRGLFGNDDLWNLPNFTQGENRDIFNASLPINVTIPKEGGSLVITFDLTNSWYFEDFDSNGVFNPCIGGDIANNQVDGCADNAEWNPIFPTPTFSFTE